MLHRTLTGGRNGSNPRQKDVDTSRGISGRRRASRDLSVRNARRGSVVEAYDISVPTDLMRCGPTRGRHALGSRGLPRASGQEMTRGEGAESARVFGMWTDLEAILVGRFCQFLDTVLRKLPKRGSQKVTNLAGDCGDCGDCDFIGRFSPINFPRTVQSPQSPQSPARFDTFWDPFFGHFRRTLCKNKEKLLTRTASKMERLTDSLALSRPPGTTDADTHGGEHLPPHPPTMCGVRVLVQPLGAPRF